MKIVIFGLTISSSWGNGHATLWRGLCAALGRRRVASIFYERDVEYYARTRDRGSFEGCDLVLYPNWNSIRDHARQDMRDADVVIVTSYCPDAEAITLDLLDVQRPLKVFYDLDTPITLSELGSGRRPAYLPKNGLSDFDLALSYTGGAALTLLVDMLGAPEAFPLYGHVDPHVHRPAAPTPAFAADLSYIGTYAEDRQSAVETLFVSPARLRSERRFVLAGAQYPPTFPWTTNTFFVRHLPPEDHPSFYASSRFTLNVTREAMARMGWCPSGRLFEAAACGAVILTDTWPGLEEFFEPGRELISVQSTEDVLCALEFDSAKLDSISSLARERVCSEHTSDHRAQDLLKILSRSRHRAKNVMEA